MTMELATVRTDGDLLWPFRVAATCSEEQLLPPAEVTEAVRGIAAETRRLAGPRVRPLLEQMLVGKGVHLALQWLHESGLLAAWLPELEATVNFSQEAGRRHKDVWEHTKQVVRQSVPRPAVRWAALLHDIGKVPTRTFTPDGGVHFHRHSEVGARMFEEVQRRFVFDKPMKQKIKFLILHHLRPNQYDAGWTDAAVRRFGRELDAHLQDLLDLSRADITSARPGKRQAGLRQISELQARIVALREEDAKLPPLPTGIGSVIMERFGLPPSKQLGDLKKALEAAVERGELEARREADYYLAFVAGILGVAPPVVLEPHALTEDCMEGDEPSVDGAAGTPDPHGAAGTAP
jgi:poly(A) polymerase